MVTLENAVVAKIKKNGKQFEILVDPEIAYSLKEGKTVSIQNMLAVNEVFTDARKGDKVSSADLQTFETEDILKVAEFIVKNGEVQMTSEYRKKKTNEIKSKISFIISKNAINPQTKLPHPQERIENAMNQAKVNIDPFKSAEDQMKDIVNSIKIILPISFETSDIIVKIPAAQATKIYGMLKEYELVSQDWEPDGSLKARMKIPSGLKDEFFKKLSNATGGTVDIKEV